MQASKSEPARIPSDKQGVVIRPLERHGIVTPRVRDRRCRTCRIDQVQETLALRGDGPAVGRPDQPTHREVVPVDRRSVASLLDRRAARDVVDGDRCAGRDLGGFHCTCARAPSRENAAPLMFLFVGIRCHQRRDRAVELEDEEVGALGLRSITDGRHRHRDKGTHAAWPDTQNGHPRVHRRDTGDKRRCPSVRTDSPQATTSGIALDVYAEALVQLRRGHGAGNRVG